MIMGYLTCEEIEAMTNNDKKKLVKEIVSSLPDGQFQTGIYVKNVGNKYVTVTNIWYKTTINKICFDCFLKNDKIYDCENDNCYFSPKEM
jgi:hypothetical protein